MARFIDELKRTHTCGQLRASDIGAEVVLFGWVQYYRDFGGVRFIDPRAPAGITQAGFDPDLSPGGPAPAHPVLPRRGPKVPGEGTNLPHDHPRRDRRDRLDGDGVLRRDRGDRGRTVDAAARECLEIGLNARASTRVRTGDRQDYWRGLCHRSRS